MTTIIVTVREPTDADRSEYEAIRAELDAENGKETVPMPTPPMTRVAFVGLASRIAQRAANWAADCAQYPGPERQGEPMEREAAMRFCASIEELLAFIKEDARG